MKIEVKRLEMEMNPKKLEFEMVKLDAKKGLCRSEGRKGVK